MATPSSSTTTPSPPLAYLHAIIPGEMDPAGLDPKEREDRQRAVDRFLARAEVSKLTRSLRTRLSYASYKATHNVPQASLGDLEARSAAQPHPQPQSAPRVVPAKRKPGSFTSYYDAPAPAAPSSSSGQPLVRHGSGSSSLGSMGPPQALPPSNLRFYTTPTHPAASAGAGAPGAESTNAARSLFASILAPPPSKQARTVRNPDDPPVAPPSKPVSAGSNGNGTRHGHGHRAARHSVDETRSPRGAGARGRERAHSLSHGRGEKGKQRERERMTPQSVLAAAGEDDMKAAATLTSLLLQQQARPMPMPLSPRSSLSGNSDLGGGAPQAHALFPPFGHQPRVASPLHPSSGLGRESTTTPPPGYARSGNGANGSANGGGRTPQQGLLSTPKRAHRGSISSATSAAPSDSEAADLMLFLATSPSPARPSREQRERRSMGSLGSMGAEGDGLPNAPFKADAGAGLRAKGRVLFAGPEEMGGGMGMGGGVGLGFGVAGPASGAGSRLKHEASGPPSAPGETQTQTQTRVTPPTPPADAGARAQGPGGGLLPAPMAPSGAAHGQSVSQAAHAPSGFAPQAHSLLAASASSSASTLSLGGPSTPGGSFNFGDFIHVSPSPGGGAGGRKLFEEERERGKGEGLRT